MAKQTLLEKLLPQINISHKWMLKSIRHNADELSEGNYSDELKLSIAVQEAIEALLKE